MTNPCNFPEDVSLDFSVWSCQRAVNNFVDHLAVKVSIPAAGRG